MNPRKIVKAFIPKKLFKVIEPYGHLAEAVIFNTINGFPAHGLKVIGVTGTNGKTTTSFLIHRMLREAGYNAGLMTTVAYGAGDEIKPQVHHMTNVTVPELMKRLKWMKSKNVEWLVLETTSQGLAQHRVWGVPYSLAVMTNVTHEHLDYHGTFERYRDAKRLLFRLCNANKKGLGIGIINAEDPSADLFASDVTKSVTYGVKSGDLRAHDVKMTPTGSSYTARMAAGVFSHQSSVDSPKTSDRRQATSDYEEYHITTHLPGSFNVYNSLAAVAVGRSIGLSKSQIEQGIAALKNVEGRMNTVDAGQDFEVIVDYAHTPDSFEKLFKDMRKVIGYSRASHLDAAQGSSEERTNRTKATESERQSVTDDAMRQEPDDAAGSAGRQGKAMRGSGKMIVMFGSAGGQRDPAKRPIQGELAGKYADEVVLTEEDDRDTDGVQILDEIAAGAEKAGKKRDQNLFLVHDRAEAIKFTLGRAKAGDTVLLLGKGHEKTIEREGREEPWDEVATARKALKEMK